MVNNRSILFLGNSLMGHALNLAQFQKRIPGKTSDSIVSYKVVPDGTSIWDWYCIVKNNFSKPEYAPDFLVVGIAWEKENPVPSRLAGHFCRVVDLGDLINMGMNSSSDILEYMVANTSMLYVLREPIRKRLLDIMVPDYREETQKINAAIQKKSDKKNTGSLYEKRNKVLTHFMKLLSVTKVKPIFVAMPVANRYGLNKTLVKTIYENNGVILDYRDLDGIKKNMYLDPIHLDERGSVIFTKKIITDLSKLVGKAVQ